MTSTDGTYLCGLESLSKRRHGASAALPIHLCFRSGSLITGFRHGREPISCTLQADRRVQASVLPTHERGTLTVEPRRNLCSIPLITRRLAMKATVMKVLSTIGKAAMFLLVALCVLLLLAERLHETFFSPVVNFIRSLI